MPETSWYRKYRPRTMDEYCGESIRAMVKQRFKNPENRPSVILIHGERGCGKTTFARIISKYYLCENPNENGEPCEQCEACQSINSILIEGEQGIDCEGVTEVDATTANGKEAIQNIIDEALIPPMYTKYKILIFDECHMITQQAQNSLLKVLEDIPSHLIVIFATTEYHKVLQTIKSRCQLQIEVKRQSVSDMADRLLAISKMEGLAVSKEACEIIARKADRVPRECINLLENTAKNHGNIVSIETVQAEVGGVDSASYLDYFNASNQSLAKVMLFVKVLKSNDVSISKFMSGLCRFVLDSLYIKHGISLEDYPADYVKEVKGLFATYGSGEFDMLLQIIESACKSLGEDNNKNELTLVTTAMRIGKVSLLAKGLAGEVRNSSVENEISLQEYYEKHKSTILVPEAVELTKSDIGDSFEGSKEVVGGDGIRSLLMGEYDSEDEEENGKSEGASETLSEEQLRSLLGF